MQQAREICISLREVIAQSTQSLTPEELKSPNVQGMYISLAFARRILKNKSGISPLESRILAGKKNMDMDIPIELGGDVQPSFAQEVFQGYELGLTAFVINEDIIVNKQTFLNFVIKMQLH